MVLSKERLRPSGIAFGKVTSSRLSVQILSPLRLQTATIFTCHTLAASGQLSRCFETRDFGLTHVPCVARAARTLITRKLKGLNEVIRTSK